jgi:hypothetical protein
MDGLAMARGRQPANTAVTVALCVLFVSITGAGAQDKGTLNPQPLPPLANPDDPATPAKELFARKTTPTTGEPQAIGFYSPAGSRFRSTVRGGK